MKTKFIFLAILLFVLTNIGIAQTKPAVATPYDQVGEQLKPLSSNQQLIKTTSTIPKATSSSTSVLDISSLSSSFLEGGNRLVAKQSTDGGWGWPLTAPPTYANIIGPIAMGLAQAYQQTGNATQRAALTKAGTFLLTKTNNFSPSDGYLAAQLDKIFGVTTYSSYVKTNFYDKLSAGTYLRSNNIPYSTTSYINLIHISRGGNMSAWDIGMGLVGAAACGASTADWIAGVKAEINELDGNQWYDVIGLAGAVYGLAYVHEDFDPTTGQHAAANNINDLANILASYQIAGGGFSWNQAWVIPNDGDEAIQETAYSILALLEVNRNAYLSNILGAANYIMSVQLPSGGWEQSVGYGENNEITGEALWGICTAYPPPVYNTSKDIFYPTIQAAINDATVGNIIYVAAGTYAGNITVNKSVTIIGDPGDANPGPGVNAPVIDGGSLPGDAFKIANGVSNVTIKGFEMRNFTSPDLDGIGNGISAWVGSTSNITIQDNSFLNLGYNGILVGNDYNSNPSKWGDHSYWTVKNNIVSNCGYIGFELTNTSNSSIEDNIIHLATPYIGAIFSSARRSETGLTIKNNQIDGTPSTGFPVIYVYAYDCDMQSPNLNSVLIEGNVIATVGSPFQIYIRNIVTGTVTGVQVHNNSLSTLKNLTSTPIDATCNWWGSASGPSVSAISGDVTFYPWSLSFPSNYCGPIAKVEKQFAKEKLTPYLTNLDKKIRHAVEEAISHINKSLKAELWKDANHLTQKGNKVFDEEKDAVEKLTDKKFNGQFKIDALVAINFLITADRTLAQVAIDDAVAVCNGDKDCQKDIDKANDEMAKAATAIGKGNFGDAIERYKNAWEKVTSKNEHEDDEDGHHAAIKSNSQESIMSVEKIIPDAYRVGQNFPNPFNPSTVIQFDVPEAATVSLRVFNTLGQIVATLISNESYEAGRYEKTFDASKLTSGVYIYQFSSSKFTVVKKMILTK
ncbi:MAG: T9SS type A sorting domain-containing protein [Ignavibacteriaceae bacterium]|jgi:parallel beta-helix repeat protein|nr:T9SS type A sorting domain-containing protein [Ignavibacteriaceae bacterium]